MSKLLAAELRRMLTEYIDFGRRQKAFVSEIEGLVIEGFQEEPWFEAISEDLSLFVPGGGDYYLDEEALAVTLIRLREILARPEAERGDPCRD